jgi:cardiolipin synthase
MRRSPRRSEKRWWHLPIAAWLTILAGLIVAVAIGCFLFIRRDVVPFRPVHTFAVSDPSFFGSAHALADPFPVAGNKIDLLHNGEQIFPAMLEAIGAAKRASILKRSFSNRGRVGSRFRDAFCERARAGVRVRILLDGLGSGTRLDNDDVKTMEKAGCQVAYYHPTHSWRIDRPIGELIVVSWSLTGNLVSPAV